MKKLFRGVIAVGALCIGTSALADSRIDEVWDCTIVEGKTMEDVRAANADWLKLVNGKIKGGKVTSSTVVAVVGDVTGFLFVDSFPDLSAYAEVKALMSTDQGQAVEAALGEVSICTSNRLYESTPN